MNLYSINRPSSSLENPQIKKPPTHPFNSFLKQDIPLVQNKPDSNNDMSTPSKSNIRYVYILWQINKKNRLDAKNASLGTMLCCQKYCHIWLLCASSFSFKHCKNIISIMVSWYSTNINFLLIDFLLFKNWKAPHFRGKKIALAKINHRYWISISRQMVAQPAATLLPLISQHLHCHLILRILLPVILNRKTNNNKMSLLLSLTIGLGLVPELH